MEFLAQFGITPTMVRWILTVSIAFGIGSLVLMPLLVIAIPRDYFVGAMAPPTAWTLRHPLLSLAQRVLRNLLGALLLPIGILMLIGPGQGLLTILVSLMLLEFPGKRRLEQRLVARPAIHRHLNWIRRLAGREPLSQPDLGERTPPGPEPAP